MNKFNKFFSFQPKPEGVVNPKKSVLSRIWLGVKKGYNIDIVPDHVVALKKHPLIRVLRIFGGISTILLVSQKVENLKVSIVLAIIAFLFLCYQMYIIYHVITHLYYLMTKTDKLTIKNSPMDKLSTLVLRAISCPKGVCEGAAGFGTIVTLGLFYDGLLAANGEEAKFIPYVNSLLGKNNESPLLQALAETKKKFSELHGVDSELKDIDLVNNIINDFTVSDNLSADEASEMKKTLLGLRDQTTEKRSELIEAIKAHMDDKKKKNKITPSTQSQSQSQSIKCPFGLRIV